MSFLPSLPRQSTYGIYPGEREREGERAPPKNPSRAIVNEVFPRRDLNEVFPRRRCRCKKGCFLRRRLIFKGHFNCERISLPNCPVYPGTPMRRIRRKCTYIRRADTNKRGTADVFDVQRMAAAAAGGGFHYLGVWNTRHY